MQKGAVGQWSHAVVAGGAQWWGLNWLEAYCVVGLRGGRYVKGERERLAAVGVGRRQKEQQPLWKDGVQGL